MNDTKKRALSVLRGAGFSNREIARILGVNESTVRRALPTPQPLYDGREQRYELIVRPL